jgi:hypothetical protein
MKGKLSAAVAGLACALTLGVAPALAGGNDSPVGSMVQSLTQSQTATNSVSQDAQAEATSLNLAPNIALGNQGDTTQSSGSTANANAANANDSSQGNGQTQTAGQSGDQGTDQSQSQTASNTIDQSAQSQATAINVSPNVAVLNDGNTTQSSGASANADATNSNRSTQVNDQSQDAQQGDTHPGCGCSYGGYDNHPSSVKQSQTAQNTIDQTAKAHAKSVNVAPNVAIGNRGDTTQSSGSSATANASNWNRSAQGNWQSQNANSQGGGQKTDQSQTAGNSIDQSATAKSTSVNAAPNVAVLNGWGNGCGCDDRWSGTKQSSGSSATANASNWNDSAQGNWQSQNAGSQGYGRGSKLDQSQTASNAVTQSADSSSTSKNWSPNVAFGNQGDTGQSSWSGASANAANGNRSAQGNEQSQDAGRCKQEARCEPQQCCEPCCS